MPNWMDLTCITITSRKISATIIPCFGEKVKGTHLELRLLVLELVGVTDIRPFKNTHGVSKSFSLAAKVNGEW